MTTTGLAAVVAAVAAAAVAGRSVIAMLDRRWVEVVCEIGAVAVLVLVLVAAGRLPLVSTRGPGVGVDGGGTGVMR